MEIKQRGKPCDLNLVRSLYRKSRHVTGFPLSDQWLADLHLLCEFRLREISRFTRRRQHCRIEFADVYALTRDRYLRLNARRDLEVPVGPVLDHFMHFLSFASFQPDQPNRVKSGR